MIFKKDDEPDGGVVGSATPPQRREGRQMTEQNGDVTVVGAAAKIDGTLVSAGSLRIDGQVKGQINADGDVTLSPQSQVEADIRAQNVSVGGRFKGTIVVKGKAHLARGGRVDGNITSKSLVIEEGAIFHGQSVMDAAAPATQQAPSSQQASADADRAPSVKVP
jgi:cytoskeletal protein CcmA (bactofilin family)